MSAINTAAIGSPAAAQHLLGSTGRSAPNTDYEEYAARRKTHNYVHSTSASSSQPTSTAFDPMWDPARDVGSVGGLAFPQLYTQQYQGQGYDMAQLQYPMDYRQVGQQATNMPSQFSGPVGYSSHDLHHTSSFTSQPENGIARPQDRQAVGGDWTHSFQGMSLGQ